MASQPTHTEKFKGSSQFSSDGSKEFFRGSSPNANGSYDEDSNFRSNLLNIKNWILSKLVLPPASLQLQSDWTESSTSSVRYIRNKPTIVGGGQTLIGTRAEIITALTTGIDTTFYDKVFITDRNIGLYLDTSAATTNSTTGTGWRLYDISKKALGLVRIDNRDGQPVAGTPTIDSVTVDSIEQLPAPVSWAGDIYTTATAVATAINVTAQFNAVAIRNMVVIERLTVGVNTDTITVTSTGISTVKIKDMEGGVATAYEIYEVDYDITNDIVTRQRDSVRNQTLAVSETDVNDNLGNPIDIMVWGSDRIYDFTSDGLVGVLSGVHPNYFLLDSSLIVRGNQVAAQSSITNSLFSGFAIGEFSFNTIGNQSAVNELAVNAITGGFSHNIVQPLVGIGRIVLDENAVFSENIVSANFGEVYLLNASITNCVIGRDMSDFNLNGVAIDGKTFTENYSDYQARNAPENTIPYDTLVGVFLTGEYISNNTTGAIGIIVSDSAGVLTIRSLSDNWNNNDSLSGQVSGATALQNGSATLLTTLMSEFSSVGDANFDMTKYAGIYEVPFNCVLEGCSPTTTPTNYIIKPASGVSITVPFATASFITPAAFVATDIVLNGTKGDYVECTGNFIKTVFNFN